MNAPSVSEIFASYAGNVTAPHVLFLDLGGCRIQVLTNSSALREELAGYFKEFLTPVNGADIVITALETGAPDLGLDYTLKEPEPGKSKIKEEYAELPDGRAVRKRLTGMVFLFGGGLNLALGPCLENPNQVVNFINNRFLEKKLNQGCLLGHAAGVELGGRGLSLAGFSGMGKSTLAMHCMSRGANFVSNDRTLVEQNGQGLVMYGIPKQPRVNPGTLLHNPDLSGVIEPEKREEFLALTTDELWKLEHKYDALIDECYGPGRFILRAPMNGLVILNWRLGGGEIAPSMVCAKSRADLLPAFMKETGLFYLPEGRGKAADRSAQTYANLLSQADLIEIAGGVDFDRAADLCLEYLETGKIIGI